MSALSNPDTATINQWATKLLMHGHIEHTKNSRRRHTPCARSIVHGRTRLDCRRKQLQPMEIELNHLKFQFEDFEVSPNLNAWNKPFLVQLSLFKTVTDNIANRWQHKGVSQTQRLWWNV